MTPVSPDVPAVELQIIEMTNAYRAQHALGTVKRNPKLDAAARAYAAYLGRTGKFSHDADGKQPTGRAQAAGYEHCQVAENLAMAMSSRGFHANALAKQAVDGWMQSPPHRRNLLAPHVSEIGVGVMRAPDKHPKYISVQMFGRPKSQMYTFRIKNAATSAVGYTFGGKSHQVGPGYSVRHDSCQPGEIAFQVASSGWWSPNTIESRFKAAGGQLFVVRQDQSGEIKVELESSASSGK